VFLLNSLVWWEVPLEYIALGSFLFLQEQIKDIIIIEYLGSLVNTYCTLDPRRIPRNRYGHHRMLAVTHTCVGTDLPGVLLTMTGSDDDTPLPVSHLSELVLYVLKAVNLLESVVLLIFQHSPASQAAQFDATKTSHTTPTDSFRPLVSSPVGF
jgi:hypothetical protein